ncbi:MAG TPA: EAL domain-containing protein [Burkholderiales bacterium]|nr:EAL domain-containing protein [Burkholderiales bacterium]
MMSEEIHVLILEGDAADAALCRRELARAGLRFEAKRVSSRSDFETALESFAPDIVISDFNLRPGFDGISALALSRSKRPDVPFIFVSDATGEDRAADAMKRGASDYLLKDQLANLPKAVAQALEKKRPRDEQLHDISSLRQREARLLGFINSTPSLMFIKDISGRYLVVNREFCRRFGTSERDVIGKTDEELFRPDQAAAFRTNDKQVVANRTPLEFEERAHYTDGKHVSIVYKFPLLDSKNEVVGIGGIVTDVTERAKAQQRLAVQHAIARVLAETVALDEVPSKLLQVTCESMGFMVGALWAVDEEANVLRCLETWHVPAQALDQFAARTRETVLRPGAGIAGRAWTSGSPVWIPDATINPSSPRARYAAIAGLQENLAFPVTVRGKITGVVDFFGPQAREPEKELLEAFATIGTQIGQFMERRDQQQKISRLNRIYAVLSSINSATIRLKGQQELLDEACRIAVEHGGFGIAWIGMLDTSTLDVVPVAWAGIDSEMVAASRNTARPDVPMGQGLLGRAIREKRATFSNDISAEPTPGGARRKEAVRRGYRSMIVLPLEVEGAAIGNFTLIATEPNFFNEAEVTLLVQLAGDLSLALENIARQQKLEKLSRIRMVSSEINAAIVRIRDPRALLKEACRIASEQGRFEMVWIGMVDPEGQEVQPVAWVGFPQGVAGAVTWTSMGAGRGAVGEAMRTHKPVARKNINADLPAGALRQEAIAKGYLSSVCVPIEVDNNVAAIIVLFAQGEGFFDEEELAPLNEMAANISLALQSISHQDKLNYLAYHDTLTGLPNRAVFTDRLEQLVRAARRDREHVAAVYLDMERFRLVNDTLGRAAGDEYLQQVARRLQSTTREQDTVARIGADCYAIAIGGIAHVSEAGHSLVDRIVAAFREPIQAGGRELRVALKAGIAIFPNDGEVAEGLCANAEAALKKAKATGERYVFYQPEINAKVAETLLLENKLRRAIEEEQFVLHYQPKLDLASGKISGLEALIRWHDPESGLVPPVRFISLLEETGLILEVGCWAIRKALEMRHKLRAHGLEQLRIAVNVSPLQLRQKDFVEVVRSAISQADEEVPGLDLEITESMIVENIEANIEKLQALRALGINIAIDDFGTGYSSLGYLARLPVHALKIDRSFIVIMDKTANGMSIVSTINSLAHSLDLKVVAEGVDSEGQLTLLKLLKCDEIQGYLFSKPLPEDELLRFLAASGGNDLLRGGRE